MVCSIFLYLISVSKLLSVAVVSVVGALHASLSLADAAFAHIEINPTVRVKFIKQ